MFWCQISCKSIYHYDTRSSTTGNLYIKHSRTEHLKSSFSRIGARIWNSISQDLRSLLKNKFKNELHENILCILEVSNGLDEHWRAGKQGEVSLAI